MGSRSFCLLTVLPSPVHRSNAFKDVAWNTESTVLLRLSDLETLGKKDEENEEPVSFFNP